MPKSPITRAEANEMMAPRITQRDSALSLLRITRIPSAIRGYAHIKQTPASIAGLQSQLIDRLTAEEARFVIKNILGCQMGQQPHSSIGADPLERGDLPTLDPEHLERPGVAVFRQGQTDGAGNEQAALGSIEPPQSEHFTAGQAQVSPIRPLGKHHVATFQVDILLDIKPWLPGE